MYTDDPRELGDDASRLSPKDALAELHRDVTLEVHLQHGPDFHRAAALENQGAIREFGPLCGATRLDVGGSRTIRQP